MDNLYETPESELIETSPRANSKLYKLSGIGVATFFGSPIAGGYLMAQNFKALGRYTEANKALLYSIVGTVAFILFSVWLETYISLPGSSYTVTQLVVVYCLAKQHQGAFIEEHQSSGGACFSNWKAFGISLLTLLLLALLVFAVVFVGELIWPSA